MERRDDELFISGNSVKRCEFALQNDGVACEQGYYGNYGTVLVFLLFYSPFVCRWILWIMVFNSFFNFNSIFNKLKNLYL